MTNMLYLYYILLKEYATKEYADQPLPKGVGQATVCEHDLLVSKIFNFDVRLANLSGPHLGPWGPGVRGPCGEAPFGPPGDGIYKQKVRLGGKF